MEVCDNIRLEVVLNGQVVAVAGIPELGVVDLNVSWIRRDPEVGTPEVRGWSGRSPEEWAGGKFEYGVGGFDVTHSLMVDWARGELAVGDVLTLRVLPPGGVDVPAKQRVQAAPRPLKRRVAKDGAGESPPGVAPDAEPGAAADGGA